MTKLVGIKNNAQLTKELENVRRHTCLQSHLIMELMLIVGKYGCPSIEAEIDAMGNNFDTAMGKIDVN